MVKQILDVIIYAALNSVGTTAVPGESFNLCQRFQNEACVKVIDEIPFAIGRVIPGAVSILRFENEVQVSFRDPAVVFPRKVEAARVSRNAR